MCSLEYGSYLKPGADSVPMAQINIKEPEIGSHCTIGRQIVAKCYPASTVRGSAWDTHPVAGSCSCASEFRLWQWL